LKSKGFSFQSIEEEFICNIVRKTITTNQLLSPLYKNPSGYFLNNIGKIMLSKIQINVKKKFVLINNFKKTPYFCSITVKIACG